MFSDTTLITEQFDTVIEQEEAVNGTVQDVLYVICEKDTDYLPWRAYVLSWNDPETKQILEPRSVRMYRSESEVRDSPSSQSSPIPRDTDILELLLSRIREALGDCDVVIRSHDTIVGGTGTALPDRTNRLVEWNGDLEDGDVSASRMRNGNVRLYKSMAEDHSEYSLLKRIPFTFADKLAEWLDSRDSDRVFHNEETKLLGAYTRSAGGVAVYSQESYGEVAHLILTENEISQVAEFLHDTHDPETFLPHQYAFSRTDDEYQEAFENYLAELCLTVDDIREQTIPTVHTTTEIDAPNVN